MANRADYRKMENDHLQASRKYRKKAHAHSQRSKLKKYIDNTDMTGLSGPCSGYRNLKQGD